MHYRNLARLPDLLGDTLAYLDANDDQIRAMARSWAAEVTDNASDADHFAYRVRMQATGLSATRRAELQEE